MTSEPDGLRLLPHAINRPVGVAGLMREFDRRAVTVRVVAGDETRYEGSHTMVSSIEWQCLSIEFEPKLPVLMNGDELEIDYGERGLIDKMRAEDISDFHYGRVTKSVRTDSEKKP